MIDSIIEDLRFAYDDPAEFSVPIDTNYYQHDFDIQQKKLNLNTRGLRISKELFPNLYKSIQHINQKLKIKNEIVFYLMPDKNHNAYCLPITNKESAVIINSSLVELLDEKEMEYIIGHEVGHHIFSHLNYPSETVEGKENIALKKLSQAAEISVDRLGLYCNNDLDACINCMMKMHSGLKPPHINFDHKAFINHLKTIVDLKGDRNQIYHTHPLMYVRAKALIIFSESKTYQESLNIYKKFKHTKKEMDEFVNRLISESEGFAFEEEQIEEYEEIRLWVITKLLISNNKWTSKERKILQNYFEEKKIKKIDSFIKDSKQSGLSPIVQINKRFNEIISFSLTKSKKEKLIQEMKILCSELISVHDHKREILLEQLSKISNRIGLEKTIHIKI